MPRPALLQAFLALAAAAALSACADARLGDPDIVKTVQMTPETAPELLGHWQGAFAPAPGEDDAVGGEVTLDVTEIDDTLLRGTMSWYRGGELWQSQKFTGAMSNAGHYMLLSTHAHIMEKGGSKMIMADILMNDGNYYSHHLTRTGVGMEHMAGEHASHNM